MGRTDTGVRPANGALVLRLVAGAIAWIGLYATNEVVWDALFVRWLGLDPDARLPGAVHFFLYDVSKILLLLVGMIFAIGMLRTTLRPERVRTFLEGKPLGVSLLLAALLGAVTPFCSCSSIPLFIGFVGAGIPLAVTLTFLVASPLVNEVAVVMLADTFGMTITVAYVVAGLVAAMVIGFILSRFELNQYVEPYVFRAPVATLSAEGRRPTLRQRVDAAKEETADIVGRIWKWVIIGVAIGAVIHGWIPAEFFAAWAGPDNPFAVVVATFLGVPLYSNAAGVIPIAEALWAKGVALGTVMSFMMATVALSVPELLLLKQVLKPRLLAIFFGTVALAIMLIGFAFNLAFT